ncbi:MAG: hypothetical protein ACRECH_12280 [Nitrososphaerales archaeon]
MRPESKSARESITKQKRILRNLKTLVFSLSLVSILDGAFKIWRHFFSTWRYDYLDYLVGAGAISVGLISLAFLAKPFRSKFVLLACLVFVIASAAKIAADLRDPFDILLSLIVMGIGSFLIWLNVR